MPLEEFLNVLRTEDSIVPYKLSKLTNHLHLRVASIFQRGNELLQAEAALSEVEAPETDRNRRLLWAVISPFKSGFCSDTSEKLP